MQEQIKTYDDIGSLMGALVATAGMTFMRTKAMPKEKHADAWKDTLMPFFNPHNIALLINDKNIAFVRAAIIEKVLPALDKDYLLWLEPTPDKTDIMAKVQYRPNGPESMPADHWAGWLSQLDQDSIFELILKFMPTNAGTEQ